MASLLGMGRFGRESNLILEISDKILELLSNKCQMATVALDKNWTYQIVSLGVGLGLIYGLGQSFV